MSRPLLRSPWIKFLTDIAVIGLLAVAWSQLAALGLYSGWPWSLWSDRLAIFGSQAVNRCLFEAVPGQGPLAAIIGDRKFHSETAPVLPSEFNTIHVDLPLLSIPNILLAVEALEYLEPDLILVQNRPWIWTDFDFTDSASLQDIRLWKYYCEYDRSVIPLESARIWLDSAELWAKGLFRPLSLPRNKTPVTFFNVVFAYERVLRDNFEAVDSGEGTWGRDVFWVFIPSVPPDNLAPQVIEDFEQTLARGSYNPRVGHFINLEDAAGAAMERLRPPGAD